MRIVSSASFAWWWPLSQVAISASIRARIEPFDGDPEAVKNAGHPAPIETAGQFVEPAPTAFRLERVELLELVEAEGHHGGEGPFVDVPHVVLEEEGRGGAAVGCRDSEMVGHRKILLGGVVLPREALEVGALVAAFDEDPAGIEPGAGLEAAAAGEVRIEDPPAEQMAETKEDAADELEERGLAGLVRAMEHFDACAEPFHVERIGRGQSEHRRLDLVSVGFERGILPGQ